MPKIHKRDGYYFIRYDAGVDSKGNRIQKYKRFHRLKDAELFLAEQIVQKDKGITEPKKLLLYQYLENWLAEHKDRLSPNTYSGYETNIRLHIIPYLGGIKLSAVKPADIRKLYRELQKDRTIKVEGEKKELKKLSGTSVRYVHRVLHKSLEDALKDEIIPRNPAALVDPPTKAPFDAGFLRADQISTMLKKFENDPMYIPVLLSVLLGLRRGEVLGLQWKNVDLKNHVVRIRHTYTMFKGKPLLLEKTKTDSSRRDIPVTQTLISILKAHKGDQRRMKKRLKTYYVSDHVCTWPDGTLFNPSHLSRNFKLRLEQFKLPVIRFHDLRHSNASLMMKEGAPLKGASERLGHATIQITQDLYVHTDEAIQRDIAEKIDRAIFGNK